MKKTLVALAIAACVVRAQAPYEANMTGGRIHYGGERFEKAANLFKTATDQRPASYDAHLWLGASYAKLQKTVPAAREFMTVLTLDSVNFSKFDVLRDPNGQPEGRELAQAALLTASVLALQQDSLPEALGYVKAALRLDPLNGDDLVQLTRVALKMNNLDEVKRTAEQILAADSTSPDAHDFMGRYHQAKGEWESAKVSFGKSLDLLTGLYESARDSAIAAEIAPSESLIRVLETIKGLRAQRDLFKAYVRDSLKITDARLPKVGPLIIRLTDLWQRLVLGYGEVGGAAFNKGDLAWAEQLYSDGARLDPENGEIAYNLGIVKFNLGKMAEAKDPLLKATQVFPSDDQALALLGAVYVALGEDFLKKDQNPDAVTQLDTAITILTKAIELNPKNANAHRALGIAYVHKGDVERNKELVNKGNELIKKGAELDKAPN